MVDNIEDSLNYINNLLILSHNMLKKDVLLRNNIINYIKNNCCIRDILQRTLDKYFSDKEERILVTDDEIKNGFVRIYKDFTNISQIVAGELNITSEVFVKELYELCCDLLILTHSENSLTETIDKRMSIESIIKEIMDSFDKTGKIGNSTPKNREEALEQAKAIAFSTKK